MFEQTKPMFGKWLYYGIGTMFSLAVLSVMVALALDMVVAVAASFWVGNLVVVNQEGINSMAMQQGGLGLILTVLIISAPPMAAAFFQGTLGQFLAHSQLGGSTGDSSASRSGEAGFRGHVLQPYSLSPTSAGGIDGAPRHAQAPLQSTQPYRPASGSNTDGIRTQGQSQQGLASL